MADRKTHEVQLNRSITNADVQKLLSSVPDLDDDERNLIKEARSAVSETWSGFLKNAKITIRLDDEDVVLVSGRGTNHLVVEEEDDGDIRCEWVEKGLGMKVLAGAKHIGRFLFNLIRKTVPEAISPVVYKAIDYIIEKLPIK